MKQIYLTIMVGLFLLPTTLISQNFSVSGLITRHNGDPIPDIDISCFNSTSSNADGSYEILDIPPNTSCQLMLEGEYEKFDDITVLDLLLLRQQLISLNNLNTFQSLAADVNHSTSITPLDVVKLYNLILNKDDGIAPNWQFLNTNTATFPSQISVNDSLNNVNFTAIKRGDIGISSDYMPPPPNASSPVFTIAEDEFELGDIVTVEVLADNLEDIVGMQSTFSWDPTLLEFTSISGMSDIIIHTNTDSIDQGQLSILTVALSEINSASEFILFTLDFKALEDAPNTDNFVKMSDEMIPRQVVWSDTDNNEFFIVEAEYIGSEVQPVSVNNVSSEIEKFDVFPNPVKETLNVNVLLKDKSSFEIEIVNILGQTVFSKKYEGKEVIKEIDLSYLAQGNYVLSLEGTKFKESLMIMKK